MPANQYLDAVGNGSLDMAWTVAGFWTGKDIAFAMFASVPFGPGMGEYLAWVHHGGGLQLSREMFAKYGIQNIPCAYLARGLGLVPQGDQDVNDLKGLKMRFFGLGAKVMAKLGVSTQFSQPGESSRRCSSVPSTRPNSRCRRWT